MFLIILKRLSLSVISPNEQNLLAILLKDILEAKKILIIRELGRMMLFVDIVRAEYYTHAKNREYKSNPIPDSGTGRECKQYSIANEDACLAQAGKDINKIALLANSLHPCRRNMIFARTVYAAVI